MLKGTIKVEQVDAEGKYVFDYDTSLSPYELFNRISNYFPEITKDEDGIIVGEYNDKKYSIRAKNVTYLGNPHPLYKKRIQIAEDLQLFYDMSLNKGYKPILLGVYTYKDNHIFCSFNIEDYLDKKSHNSSAHVYSEDIAIATTDNFYQMIDGFNNKITVFDKKGLDAFLEDFFEDTNSDFIVEGHSNREKGGELTSEIINSIEDYFVSEDKEWNGIECYTEMIEENFHSKFQAEWPGSYLEFSFERYINKKSLTRFIKYYQDRTRGGIDLDLVFPEINQFGDLKAHSNHSPGVQGNDWDTVKRLVNNGQHIYYIICEHSTEKDSNHNYVVTEFWNKAKNKDDLRSYSDKMKYSVSLKKAYILDINKNNFSYLSKYKQGLNSNGKPRPPKIMIKEKEYDHFVIKEIPL